MVKSIPLNEKHFISEKLIDFGEVTSLTLVTVTYSELKIMVKQRERNICEKQCCLEKNEYVKTYYKSIQQV